MSSKPEENEINTLIRYLGMACTIISLQTKRAFNESVLCMLFYVAYAICLGLLRFFIQLSFMTKKCLCIS